MANIQNFSVTPGSAVQVNAQDVVIAGTVQDDSTPPKTIADYTGANAIHFPAVLATLSAAQQAEILDLVSQQILLMKAGVAT